MEGPRIPNHGAAEEIKQEDWNKIVGFLRSVKDLPREEQRERLNAELGQQTDETYKRALTERFETIYGEAFDGEHNSGTPDVAAPESEPATEEDLDKTITVAQQRKEEIKKKRDDLRDSLTERYGKRGQRVEGTRGSFWLDSEDKAHIVRGDGHEQIISVNEYNNFGNRTNPEWRKWLGSSAGGWSAVSPEEGQEAYRRRQTGRTIRETIENARPASTEAAVTETRDEKEARLRRELAELEASQNQTPTVADAAANEPQSPAPADTVASAPRPIFSPRTPLAAPAAAPAPAPAPARTIAAPAAPAAPAAAAPQRNIVRRFVDWVRGRNNSDITDNIRGWVNEPMRVPQGRSRIGHLMDTWRMTREQAERLNAAHKALEMQRKLQFRDAINVTEMSKEKLYWATKMKRWPKWSALGTSAALIAAHSAKSVGLVTIGSMIGIAAPAVIGTLAAAYSYKTNRNLKSSLMRGVLAGTASYLIGEYAAKWVMNYFGAGANIPNIDPTSAGPTVPFSPNPNLEMSVPNSNSILTPKFDGSIPADPSLEMSTPGKTSMEIPSAPTAPKVAEPIAPAPSAPVEPTLPPLQQFPDPVNSPQPDSSTGGTETRVPDLKSNPGEPPVAVAKTPSGLPPAPPPINAPAVPLDGTGSSVPVSESAVSVVSDETEKILRNATYAVLEGSAADTSGLDGWMKEYFFDSIGKSDLDERSKLQFTDAMRRVFTSTPEFADAFFGATDRVIQGADGLDLQFNAGDNLDMRVLSNPSFREELYHTIVQKERILTRALGGADEVAKLLRITR